MEELAQNFSGPMKADAHYSYIRSLNNDLVLLGNALMTKNNDINSVHDFVSDSISTLGCEKLKGELAHLNESVIGCDNDEDRLRLLAKMQHLLAQEALPYLDADYLTNFKDLSLKLSSVETAKGDSLKADVSRFQIDVLRFIPGVEEDALVKLHDQAQKVVQVSGKALTKEIDVLYEDINLLIQPSFDDLDM